MSQSPWHVLFVVANHEKKVAQHLLARSVEHYLPLYAERSRWSDRWVMVERPLFVGYVFVRYSSQTRLSVISTPGVVRLLGDSTNDAVSSEEIERIRQGLASGCLLRPHFDLRIGTPVRVRRGVFEGLEGSVAELRQRCKVVMRLSCLKQCFSLEVDRDEIEVLRKTAIGRSLVEARSLSHSAFRSHNEIVFTSENDTATSRTQMSSPESTALVWKGKTARQACIHKPRFGISPATEQ